MANPIKNIANRILAPRQVKRNKVHHQYTRMPRDYSLIKEIREDGLYKSNVQRRDTRARKIIDQLGTAVAPGNLIAGNLYLMHYFYPKTE